MDSKTLEIPFGAKDSEFKGFEYRIPEGMEAEVKDDKVIIKPKESEDERIRKFLIGLLSTGTWKRDWPFSPVECVAWLEKQKEQKPAENLKWAELTWKDIVELEGIINNVHYDFSAGIGQESFGKEVLERFRNKKDDAEVDACKQQPAEKQDYSGLNDLESAIHRGFLCAGVQNVSRTIIEETAQDCLAQMKPTEWSEEDEKKITFLERLIRYNVPEGQYGWTDGHKGGVITKLEAIALLKSLRPQPHWKPSEEQMKALVSVLPVLRGSGSNVQKILESLYDDLEKLT